MSVFFLNKNNTAYIDCLRNLIRRACTLCDGVYPLPMSLVTRSLHALCTHSLPSAPLFSYECANGLKSNGNHTATFADENIIRVEVCKIVRLLPPSQCPFGIASNSTDYSYTSLLLYLSKECTRKQMQLSHQLNILSRQLSRALCSSLSLYLCLSPFAFTSNRWLNERELPNDRGGGQSNVKISLQCEQLTREKNDIS